MDRRFLTVLGVSLVFALVVTSIFYQLTTSAGPQKAEVTDLTDIVVAVRPLPVGMTVKAADLKVVKVATSAFPKGAYSKPEDVLDRPVVSNILHDEPILDGRLAQRGSGFGLSPIIPVGMRAVTVRVNDVIGVAGFVLPGMRVDVLITGQPPGSVARVTKTVLQNILILSAGATIQTDPSGKPVNAPNVTVLVTPPQAEMITLAGNEGRIQLVLRNAGDQGIESTAGLTTTTLYGAHARSGMAQQRVSNDDFDGVERPRPRPRPAPVAVAAPPPLPAPVSSVDQIVVIRGTDRKVETVSSQKSGEFGRIP